MADETPKDETSTQIDETVEVTEAKEVAEAEEPAEAEPAEATEATEAMEATEATEATEEPVVEAAEGTGDEAVAEEPTAESAEPATEEATAEEKAGGEGGDAEPAPAAEAAEPAAPAKPAAPEHTYEELNAMTVAQLREVAAGIEHDAVHGYTTMHKEHLVPALCEALGIEAHEHHEVVGINKKKVKAQIRQLKKERDAAEAAGDKTQLKRTRRRIRGLKRKIRKATV